MNKNVKHKIVYFTNQLINTKVRRLERGSPEFNMTKEQYEAKVSKINSVLRKLETQPEWANKD
jgi:hypothetical protein